MKRVYITHLSTIIVDNNLNTLSYQPYMADIVDSKWQCITSEKHTDGIFDSYIYGIDTTEENHVKLENDKDITRIDDL